MIAVIFEVEPAEGRFDEYLDHAARLRPTLEKMPGFMSVERFRSLTNPQRCHAGHRASQSAGRDGIFAGYRLRVAAVLRDYGLAERRAQAPEDSVAVFG